MKSRVSFLFMALVLLMQAFHAKAAPSPIVPMRVDIIKSEDNSTAANYAAEELARYIEAMTQAAVTLHEAGAEVETADIEQTIIELQVGEAAADLRDLPRGDDPEIVNDGFIIRSTAPNRLMIAALEPHALLYGVYHYLEFVCGCGFFFDGDYIPQRSDLPVAGIDIAELPRWRFRHFHNPRSWGMDKYHPKMRERGDRFPAIDWFAKRKLNWTVMIFRPMIELGGVAAKEVFGLDDTTPSRQLYGGFPGDWIFPAQVHTDLIKTELDYGRALGIKYLYGFPYGTVPFVFRERYPDLPYIPDIGYDSTVLRPETEEAWEWSKKYLEKIIEVYGTDHVYESSALAESRGAESLDEAFRLRVEATERLCRLIKTVDEQGIWQHSTWDMSVLEELWTPERTKRFFEEIPHEMTQVYDLIDFGLEPEPTAFETTNYFYGTDWFVGFLHSFQGDEHLHGKLGKVIDLVRNLSRNPDTGSLIGIGSFPEAVGHNVLYFDLTTNLTWNPENMTLDGYLAEFARRRYGKEAAGEMFKALKAVVTAVHEDKLFYLWNPQYEKYGEMHGAANYPMFKNLRSRPAMPHIPKELERLPQLAEAIETALALRGAQQDNELFENDLLVWMKTYADLVFSWAAYEAYESLTEGDEEGLEKASQLALEAMDWIKWMLSTRPDYSLQRQIDNILAVPGANPEVPYLLKQHNVNWFYSTNDNYEQYYYYYQPRMQVYFDTLNDLAAEGETEVSWEEDLAEESDQYLESWLEKPIRVADEDKYPGTTMEAIVDAWENLSPHQDYIQSIIEANLAEYAVPEDAVVYTVRNENIERNHDWFYEFNASTYGHWMYWSPGGEGENEFTWNFDGLQPGRYEISVWVSDDPNNDHPTEAPYTVRSAGGQAKTVKVDTTTDLRSWHKLGTFELDGESAVTLTNDCEGNPVADSVMLVPVE